MAAFDPDAFLSESGSSTSDFDPDAFIGSTTTRSDAAPAQNSAPPEDEQQARIRKLLEDSNKTFGMNNEALLAGMVRIPALGFRQDLGQFGAAIMDKAMGSEIPFGDLVKRAKTQVEKYYKDLEDEHPIASGVGTAIGGTPMAMAVNPATAGVSKLASATKMAPWLAKTLGIGAAGVDNALVAGALGFNETGDTDKALDDAKIAGVLGAGFAAAPVVYQGAKQLAGKAAQMPRQGIDSLAKMLAPADEAAAPIAQAADNVIPIRQDQADIETKMTPIRNFLRDADGSMYLGGKAPKNKDPAFLAKSKELADMLAQDADTAITPVDMSPNSIHENATPNQIQDGAKYAEAQGLDPDVPFSAQGGPHIKHKGAYRNKGYSFPQEKPGWDREPHWWKAGAEDSEPSGGIMDLMMQESETPQQAAAWEALNKGERNMSKWRNPSDVDSGLWRQPAPFPEPVPASSFDAATKPRVPASKADMPTNAKGGGGSMYDPMGLGDAPNVRPSDAELFADVRRKAAAAGKPDFSTAREATPGEEAIWGEALNRLRAKGLIENVEDAGKLGTRKATEVLAQNFPDPITMTKPALAPFPDPVTMTQIPQPGSASMPPPPVADNTANIAAGKDRIRKILGEFGKYSGAIGGFKSGGIMGAIGGAEVGAKAMPRTFDKLDKGADKLNALGQKLLTDPAKLQQLEMQGGQMGKAASFIMEGAREGGESAMAARAFIISSQPWWRQQFAEEQEAN